MGTLLLYPSFARHLFHTDKMKAFVAVFASALAAASAGLVPAALPASTLIRAPAHDSASIESHRLGGNFAYATAEAHAFAKVTPQLATRTIPVAETTHIHTPAAIRTIQPGAITTTRHEAHPILKQEPVFAQEPVIGPVATHTTYEQPLYKTRTYTQTAVAHHAVAAPAVTYAAAPAAAIAAAPAIQYSAAPAAAIAAAPAASFAALPAGNLGYAAAPAFAHGFHGLPAIAGAAPAIL